MQCPVPEPSDAAVVSCLGPVDDVDSNKRSRPSSTRTEASLVDIEPAQNIIRDIFISHIIKAKGLDNAREFIGKTIIPTPRASLQAAGLLADGTENEPGIGSLLVIEIGGATTNIHSAAENSPVNSQTIMKGLPEQKLKRTVEGDLGIRYNAHTIYELVGEEILRSRLASFLAGDINNKIDIKQYVENINSNVDFIPQSNAEYNLDITLA